MNLVRQIWYALGFRPKSTSILFSAKIESEEKWRTGK